MSVDKRFFLAVMAAVLVLVMVVMTSAPHAQEVQEPELAEQFTTYPGEGTTVQPARATWITGFFLEALYSRAMEHLGYRVLEHRSFANPIFYRAVVMGNVDYWANGWFPLQNKQLPESFDQKAARVGHVVKKGAVQGYLASKKHVEKFNITSLKDFKREEVKETFDANGDGKADLISCPPGWGCASVIKEHMDIYDLHDHVNLVEAAYAAGMASALARYEQGKAVFFYTWTPNWTVFKLKPGKDVMWLNVPFIQPTSAQKGLKDAMSASGLDGAVTDPVKLGFVINDIRCVANKRFLEENPSIKRLFEVMSVPFEDIAAQNSRMFEGEDTQEDVERHVTEWIMEHKEQWKAWLQEASHASD
jgi:glycine betaine/proline transport system substrate-binding protein